MLFQFQVQYAQWTFLRREKLRGRPIPTTNEEIEWRWRLKPTREFIEIMQLMRRRKEQLEEARPGYTPPPRPATPNSQQVPLKIRPFISSAYGTPAKGQGHVSEENDNLEVELEAALGDEGEGAGEGASAPEPSTWRRRR